MLSTQQPVSDAQPSSATEYRQADMIHPSDPDLNPRGAFLPQHHWFAIGNDSNRLVLSFTPIIISKTYQLDHIIFRSYLSESDHKGVGVKHIPHLSYIHQQYIYTSTTYLPTIFLKPLFFLCRLPTSPKCL